jgi:drebrin-like protein
MAALRAGKSDTTSSTPSAPEIVKSSYTPIGRVDIAAIRAQAQQQQKQPEPKSESSYVGTSGYQPVQLSKPKPLTSRFGPTVGRGGTIAPMPYVPVQESKVIGGASKNFATDASGKTPSQLWAERKAREKGLSVTPDVAPQRPLPTMRRDVSPPGRDVEDSADVSGKPVSGGVAAMKERFAKQSLDEEQSALPISPGPVRPVARSPTALRVSPPSVPSPPAAPSPPGPPSPPPISMSSKPPPARTYQSLDDVVAAGAGAGVGIGIGAMASQALHHEEPEEPEEEEDEHGEREQLGYSPVETRTHGPWDTVQPPQESEDEEDVLSKQRAQVPEVQEHEPQEHTHEEEQHEQSSHTAQSSKTAVVLFDYEAQEDNEINLIEGQIITNIEFIDDVSPTPPLQRLMIGMVGR